MALYHQLKFPSTLIEYRSVSEWKGGGSHMNVSYNCLIFHTDYTVDLKRFTNLMSIGLYFRLSRSTLQRFKINFLPLCQNTYSLCGGGTIVPACEDATRVKRRLLFDRVGVFMADIIYTLLSLLLCL